jgi:5'-phosphate synthase pdxT subunit
MKVGVLALQGDVREHLSVLNVLGVDVIGVRTASEIQEIDALVIPGGESTTIAKLARSFGLFELIQNRIRNGMPTFGTCAGMILLADLVADAGKAEETFGGLAMTVKRNAFGRQVDSFETELDFKAIPGERIKAIFIRAPWVEKTEPSVEILSSIEISGNIHPVAVRQGHLLATAFHPEISGDNRIHKYFITEICQGLSSTKLRGD